MCIGIWIWVFGFSCCFLVFSWNVLWKFCLLILVNRVVVVLLFIFLILMVMKLLDIILLFRLLIEIFLGNRENYGFVGIGNINFWFINF